MHETTDNTGNQSVKEFAEIIIEMCADTNYWCEISMMINGKRVNMESIVTFVDGKPYGPQVAGFSALPPWKRWVKRMLKI